uniref:Uncharacterized protein n=1 Tax=Rhizophora mucronata TaxID=61149 RepID=A0A2P2NJI3_RHIMU
MKYSSSQLVNPLSKKVRWENSKVISKNCISAEC